MSGGGYTATTESLSTAAKTIGDLAEHLLDDNPDLQNSQVTAEKFGRAHGAHAAKYTAGAQALWADPSEAQAGVADTQRGLLAAQGDLAG